MLDIAEAFKFKLLQSTPYYAQANGQAESSNKVIINIIMKMLEKNPKHGMRNYQKLSRHIELQRERLQDLDGDIYVAPINSKWLKKFYPTMWDSQAVQTDPGIEDEQDRIVV
ncbi:hypothetical protein L3X38_030293 [Prunus dulcis]|uniref:Integrase catalytic domain-containing protein n=1 Tax=Prunus dulcis TaxID=3755 RepID=A0AAD4VBI1_PRUDU|nr:hypothetical protein L3X38_030293 [Prunus dulcis]